MTVIKKGSRSEQIWGQACKAWTLLDTDQLTIKEELMPPGFREETHHHRQSQQFFFILAGVATFCKNGLSVHVHAGEGFDVRPGTIHSIENNGDENLRFLLISNPSADGDRHLEGEKPKLNLGGRRFVALSNSDSGEVSDETIFYYHQKGDTVWATYEGGDIVFGTLSGQIMGEKLKFNYQHRNRTNEYMTGMCHTDIQIVNGKIQLHEKWKWTCADFSQGTSILEEL